MKTRINFSFVVFPKVTRGYLLLIRRLVSSDHLMHSKTQLSLYLQDCNAKILSQSFSCDLDILTAKQKEYPFLSEDRSTSCPWYLPYEERWSWTKFSTSENEYSMVVDYDVLDPEKTSQSQPWEIFYKLSLVEGLQWYSKMWFCWFKSWELMLISVTIISSNCHSG